MTNTESVEIDGRCFKVISEPARNSCDGCSAESDPLLCSKLHYEYNCEYRGVIFQEVSSSTPEEDMVNQPKHYQLNIEGTTIEVRDVCRVLANRLGSKGFSGMFIADYVQMLQYIMRFDCKNGKEDLEKSKWYLEKILEGYEK